MCFENKQTSVLAGQVKDKNPNLIDPSPKYRLINTTIEDRMKKLNIHQLRQLKMKYNLMKNIPNSKQHITLLAPNTSMPHVTKVTIGEHRRRSIEVYPLKQRFEDEALQTFNNERN